MSACRRCGWRFAQARYAGHCKSCAAAVGIQRRVWLSDTKMPTDLHPEPGTADRRRQAIVEAEARVRAWEAREQTRVPTIVIDQGVVFVVTFDGHV